MPFLPSSPLYTLCEQKEWGLAATYLAKCNKKEVERPRRKSGYTPLHIACQHGADAHAASFIEQVIEKSNKAVTIKAKWDDMLPLHCACKAGASHDVLKLLVEKYEEALGYHDVNGRSPLHCRLAADTAPSEDDVVLLTSGAGSYTATRADLSGDYPLHIACRQNAPPAIIKLLLLNYPGALERKNKERHTPLALAKNEEVRDMLKKGKEHWKEEAENVATVFGRWELADVLQRGQTMTLSSLKSVTKGVQEMTQTTQGRERTFSLKASLAPTAGPFKAFKFDVGGGRKLKQEEMNSYVQEIGFKEDSGRERGFSYTAEGGPPLPYIWQYVVRTEFKDGTVNVFGTNEFTQSVDLLPDPDVRPDVGKFWLQHRKRKKVIDAYFIVPYPSARLERLYRSRHLADLKGIAEDIVGHDVGGAALDRLRERDYQIIISDGYRKQVSKVLKESDVRLLIWCSEGEDECQQEGEDISIRNLSSAMKADVILVCMRFGARSVAEKLHETTSSTVVWMQTDPLRGLRRLCATVLLPFLGSMVPGDDSFEESFQLLKDGVRDFDDTIKCDVFPAKKPSNETPTSRLYRRKLIDVEKWTPAVTVGSRSTKNWPSSRGLRDLQIHPADLDTLHWVSHCLQVVGFERPRETDCLFLRLDSEGGGPDGVLESRAYERTRALALCACDEVSFGNSFHEGVFRIASEENRKDVYSALDGKTENALLWIDFTVGAPTDIFSSAIELHKWIHGLGVDMTLLITSSSKNAGFIGGFIEGCRELMSVHVFKVMKHVEPDLTVNDLRGFLRILPCQLEDKPDPLCVLDSGKMEKETLKNEFITFLNSYRISHNNKSPDNSDGFRDDDTSLQIYRDDDNSLQISVSVRTIEFLTWLRDVILVGWEHGSYPETLKCVQFDRTALAEVYEDMILRLHNETDHQRKMLAECQNQKRVHIQGHPGSGKTFIAVNAVLEYLKLNRNADGDILYVCRNSSLAFHFAKWLCCRQKPAWRMDIDDVLSKLCVLSVEKPESIYGIRYSSSKAVLEAYERTAGPFGFIVVDEAHDIFASQPDGGVVKLQGTIRDILGSNGDSMLMILSDASQASVSPSEFDFPTDLLPDLHPVELTEVCRSSKSIVMGSMLFQLENEPSIGCPHDSDGPPLQDFRFDRPDGDKSLLYDKYAERVMRCIDHLLATFPGLDLHDRIAVIVPDDNIRDELRDRLRRLPLRSGEALAPVTARKASASLNLNRSARRKSGPVWVVDSIDQMSGLERLVVVGVGLDRAMTDPKTNRISCARIFRAITRAHLMFYIVNERIDGGWFEFLDHLEFRRYGSLSFQEVLKQLTRAAHRATHGTVIILDEPVESASANRETASAQVSDRTGEVRGDSTREQPTRANAESGSPNDSERNSQKGVSIGAEPSSHPDSEANSQTGVDSSREESANTSAELSLPREGWKGPKKKVSPIFNTANNEGEGTTNRNPQFVPVRSVPFYVTRSSDNGNKGAGGSEGGFSFRSSSEFKFDVPSPPTSVSSAGAVASFDGSFAQRVASSEAQTVSTRAMIRATQLGPGVSAGYGLHLSNGEPVSELSVEEPTPQLPTYDYRDALLRGHATSH